MNRFFPKSIPVQLLILCPITLSNISYLGSPPRSHSAQMYGPGRMITYKPTDWANLINSLQNSCYNCRAVVSFW